MIKLTLEQAKLMKTIVDAMSAVSVEVAIEVNEIGFRAQAKDQGTTWIVDAFIDKSLFTGFETTEPLTFLVDLKDFSDFIRTSKGNDTLIMQDNSKDGTLDLELTSAAITKKLSLRLRDAADFKFMKIIDRKFHSTLKMDADLFSEAIKAAELGDEHVTITNSKKNLHFEAKSSSRVAEATIHYDGNDQITDLFFADGKYKDRSGEEVAIPEVHIATYGLRYLKHISKIGRAGTVINFGMSNQAPLRITFDLEDEKCYLAFAVAPRMKEDDAY